MHPCIKSNDRWHSENVKAGVSFNGAGNVIDPAIRKRPLRNGRVKILGQRASPRIAAMVTVRRVTFLALSVFTAGVDNAIASCEMANWDKHRHGRSKRDWRPLQVQQRRSNPQYGPRNPERVHDLQYARSRQAALNGSGEPLPIRVPTRKTQCHADAGMRRSRRRSRC